MEESRELLEKSLSFQDIIQHCSTFISTFAEVNSVEGLRKINFYYEIALIADSTDATYLIIIAILLQNEKTISTKPYKCRNKHGIFA
jgi:hypothetical protein